jgi:hypothetical protein
MHDEVVLRRLVADQAIRQLAYRYAVAIDSRDFDLLASCFVDDVRIAPGRSGRDELVAEYKPLYRHIGRTIHNVGNHLIELDADDDDKARGTVYCRCEYEDGEEWIVQQIVYEDRYACRNGAWYLQRRIHRLFYGTDVLTRPNNLPPAGEPELARGRGSMPEFWPTYQAFYADA